VFALLFISLIEKIIYRVVGVAKVTPDVDTLKKTVDRSASTLASLSAKIGTLNRQTILLMLIILVVLSNHQNHPLL
jgi:hypothetical protein